MTLSYNEIRHYTITITANGDLADVYFPQLSELSSHSAKFPIALMLQGALVDKSNYSNFASQVASYGFVVVVPNHEGTNAQGDTGLFPKQEQLNDVLAQMRAENRNPESPIFKLVDTDKLGLLGHSFGGAVGLGATQEKYCLPGFCSGDYSRPAELKAGIFYGAAFGNPKAQEFLPLNNDDISIGLIVGSLDGVAPPAISQATYDQIRNLPKVLITVKGANHYGITNEDSPREPNRPTLDQAAATTAIARSSGLFLRANMLSDCRAFDAIFNASTHVDSNISIISQI